MKVPRKLALLAFVLLVAQQGLGYVIPPHPRLFVQAHDLSDIRKKISVAPFRAMWTRIEANDSSALSLAFRYLVTKDEAVGQQAIQRGVQLVKKGRKARDLYNPLLIGACVYDWCYPLLSEEDKKIFIQEFKRIAKRHEPGYPARADASAVVGHTSEGWLLSGQLPAGLAIYDEEPTMFTAAEKLLKDTFVPVRNFHYQAHMHHQGDSYISTRFQHDIMASWLFRRASLGEVFSEDQQFVPYQLLYHLRPDGMQLRSGDTSDDRGRDARKRLIALLTGSYYQDPYLLTFADMDLFAAKTIEDKIFELLFRPLTIEKKPLSDLPLAKYFPEPMGEMIVRTGWAMGVESNAAVIHMRIGNYFFGNHQRKDFGTFQIYYKGALALSSGVYGGDDLQAQYGKEYWMNYYHQTSSQNGLLIYDASAPFFEAKRPSVNDGGQYWPNHGNDHPRNLEVLKAPENGYRMGSVTDYGFYPDSKKPSYSYICGDISAAYPDNAVNKVTRSMVTINTGRQDIPCFFIVYDQVDAKSADFKKVWSIHSQQEPAIDGNTITIIRNETHYKGHKKYNGKLIVHSLLPVQKQIQKEGADSAFRVITAGKDFSASKQRKGVEAGRWSTTVTSANKAQTDEFLHVAWVSSASENIPAPDIEMFREQEGGVRVRVDGHTLLFTGDRVQIK